jgi:pimeloyl-ACP methyl ester carboxylesterase
MVSSRFDARAVKTGDLASLFKSFSARPYLTGAVAAAAVLGVSALVNQRLAKKAERDNPPRGRFIDVRGVRLHVVEEGYGEPLVLLHGNGSMVEDFESSGLIELAAQRYRVIAIDRPGFGHSARPRGEVWTDVAQAELIADALDEMGVSSAIVLGHSWGCSVAVALGLNHPHLVSALVLASGFYYPSVRAEAVPSLGLQMPVLGDAIRFAVSPVLARAMWPLVLRKLFGPAPTPEKFAGFPKEMTFRPSQLQASAADTALMVPDAAARSGRYGELAMPVVIIAGEKDRLVDTDKQSARLHADLPQSTLHVVAGAGHMVHQTATQDVMDAIDEAAELRTTKQAVAVAREARVEPARAS